ncbi:MAG: VOC family protein [Lachnospiraceae bacterium]|nr:VOC family protein [Lachnospiraceae bacterium]
MKITHIAMYVSDLKAARDFFVQYFDAVPGNEYKNEKTGFRSVFFRIGDGARLELMNRPGVKKEDSSDERTGYAHVAFSLGSRERVDELTARLKADGYSVESGPRVTGDGYYESSVIGFENNRIELTV